MLVMIAGGGRTGSHLAGLLMSQGHEVRLVESRPETLAGLHRELPTEVIFEGDPTDPNSLAGAGIQNATVLAAVTPDDADNLVIAALAASSLACAGLSGASTTRATPGCSRRILAWTWR